ncbi:MAG: hypothetical protein ACJ8DC_04610 [Gemmatimonadales bacterium]
MTWRKYIGGILTIFAVKWLISHRGEHFAALVVVGALAAVLVIAYLRHVHRQQTDLTVLQAHEYERPALLSCLPPAQAASLRFTLHSFEDLDLSAPPPPAEFFYPGTSRSLSNFLFWGAAVVAGGFLSPLARGMVSDAGSAVMLLGLALLFLSSAAYYRRTYHWIEAKVRVDRQGITEVLASGQKTCVLWYEVALVRHRRWLGALDFEATDGRRIRVWLTLIDFARFAELVVIQRHRHNAGALGARPEGG